MPLRHLLLLCSGCYTKNHAKLQLVLARATVVVVMVELCEISETSKTTEEDSCISFRSSRINEGNYELPAEITSLLPTSGRYM